MKSHLLDVSIILLIALFLPGFFSPDVRGDWIIEIVDSSGEVREHCSIALDSTETPHIAYQSEVDRGLFFARKDTSGWNTERLHPWSTLGYYCSLAFDSNDLPAIAHQQDYEYRIRYSYYDGSEWQLEVVDESANVGQSVSLVFDSADRPHIGYTNFSINDLRCAYKYTGLWIIEELGVPGYCADLVLSPAGGFPHLCSMWPIAYHMSYLYYTRKTPSGWESFTILDSDGPGNSAKIALGVDGLPMIAHRDSNKGNLYVHRLGSDDLWHEEVVDPGPYISGNLDLVVDNQGQPHISYHDGGLGHLKYATYDGSGWVLQTVDTDGVVGAENTIAVDSAGIPHIAYHDSGRKHLRYAQLQKGPPWFDLEMSDTALSPGDTFQLNASSGNTTASAMTADQYILLDVYGSYFFYPGWSQSVDYNVISIDPFDEYHQTILTFTWPEGAGSASGLYFYGALFHASTFDMIDMDSIEWNYSE